MPKKHKRSALEKLQKHWLRASADERRSFLASLHARDSDPEGACGTETFLSGRDELIANGRYLLPLTVARIEKIMIARRIGPSEAMAEMGFAGQGTALARALIRKASIRLRVIAALQDWLRAQEAASAAKPGAISSEASQGQPGDATHRQPE
ncbi:hypothetical protein J2858_004186 [Neorhizobium galegae]|uniref:hypothetical protein n=1 Tax=Neorhizobium galegae TaxID=399 RepID=UPI001AE9C744|nr:hypothetical protein [Neorhizobium galegae]MBP2551245.1 hypothetical protein [Neorhizobium galegae]